MATQVTYARILEVVTQGEDRFYRIAVQLPGGGEWSPGLIPASGYVMGDGLIFGAWVGEKFVPFRGGSGGGGGWSSIMAHIHTPSLESPNRWRYQWYEVEPGPTRGTWSSVGNGRNSDTDGYAFNGLEASHTSSGTMGSGVNINTLPQGFAPVPLGPGAVRITGPHVAEDGETFWHIEASPHVDGTCQTGAVQQ